MPLNVESKVRYRGVDWVVLPGVFAPRPDFGETILVTPRNIEMYRGKRVLDIGCGCGVRGIIAAASGATHVEAVDIMPNALISTIANATNIGVEIEVYYSNLFMSVTGEFDAIVAYLPSFDEPIVSYNDIACNDPGLALHIELMSQAHQYLSIGGVLHIAIYGDNVARFECLIEKFGYSIVEYKVFSHLNEAWHFYDLSC